jgi:hypothetical protein
MLSRDGVRVLTVSHSDVVQVLPSSREVPEIFEIYRDVTIVSITAVWCLVLAGKRREVTMFSSTGNFGVYRYVGFICVSTMVLCIYVQ